MRNNRYAFCLIFTASVILLACAVRPCRSEEFSVPKESQDLYSELDDELNRIEKFFELNSKTANYPVLFGATLSGADPILRDKLLAAGQYDSIVLELNRLKSLGVQAVTIRLGFPYLYQPFYKTKKDYELYMDFYKRLRGDIKERGMKLVIEAQAFSPGSDTAEDSSEAAEFCRKFKFKGYVKARGRAAAVIAAQLQPDYLSIINEPDTEEAFTGQPLDDPDNSALLVNYALSQIKKYKLKGVKSGSG